MTIKNITTNDLRKMNNKEGLILQGCGGEVKGLCQYFDIKKVKKRGIFTLLIGEK